MVPSGSIRGGGVARIPNVQINAKAPNGMKRPGGVLVDGQQLAQGAMGEARAAQIEGQAVGKALEDMGAAIGTSINRVVMARESAELQWAHAQMDTAFSAYRAGLPEDPSDWNSGWKDKFSEVKDQLLGGDKKYSPALRERLTADLDKWNVASQGRLSTMAITQNSQIAKTLTNMTIQQRIENEDLLGVESAVANGIHSGTIAPEIGAMMIQNATKKIDFAQKSRFAYNQPFEAEPQVEKWNLPEKDKFQISKMIDGRKDEVKRDEFKEALNMTLNNKGLPYDIWLNNVQTFAPHLEPADIENLNRHRLGTMETDAKTFNDFAERARSFSSKSQPWEYAKFELEVGNNIQESMQNDILGIAKAAINSSQDAFSFRLKNGLDLVKKSVDRKFGYTIGPFGTIPPDKLEKEKELQRRQMEFMNYMQTHPDADENAIERFVDPEGFMRVKMNEQRMKTDPVVNSMFMLKPQTPRYQEQLSKSLAPAKDWNPVGF